MNTLLLVSMFLGVAVLSFVFGAKTGAEFVRWCIAMDMADDMIDKIKKEKSNGDE